MSRLLRAVARPLMATPFVASGVQSFQNPQPLAERAKPALDQLRQVVPQLPADDAKLVQANAAVQVGAGALFALGRFPRLSALALTASLVPTTVAGHPFWAKEDPAERAAERIQFAKNASLLGGLLFAAASTRRKSGRCASGHSAKRAGGGTVSAR